MEFIILVFFFLMVVVSIQFGNKVKYDARQTERKFAQLRKQNVSQLGKQNLAQLHEQRLAEVIKQKQIQERKQKGALVAKQKAGPFNKSTRESLRLIEKMTEYRKNLEKLAAESESIVYSHRLEKVLQSFDDWEDHVQSLVKRLMEFESNTTLKRERPMLKKKILEAQYQLDLEKDPRLQKEIQETLDSYLKQQAQLENLRFLMEKTRLDLEEFVAGIGAIYSQFQSLEAIDVRNRRAQRLAHEIEEERAELDDLLAALDEVYDTQS